VRHPLLIVPRLAGLAALSVGSPAPPSGAPRGVEVVAYLSTAQHTHAAADGSDGSGGGGGSDSAAAQALPPAVALLGGPGDAPAAPRLACAIPAGQGGSKAARNPTHASVVHAPRHNGAGGNNTTSPQMVSLSNCAAPPAPHDLLGGFTVVYVAGLYKLNPDDP
jgi:hypothetical protein